MSTDDRVVEDQVNGFAGRVEVMERPSGRRAWPDEVKARIVRESLEPAVTVSARWRVGIGFRRTVAESSAAGSLAGFGWV